MLKSEAFPYSKPLGIQIGSNNRGPGSARQHTQYDADGPLPDSQYRLACLQPQRLDALHAGVDWLQKTRLLKRDPLRNLYRPLLDDPIHHPDVFGEPPAGRLKACRASNQLIGRALRECRMTAVVTLPARDVMKYHYPVARLKLPYSCTHRRNHARGFVSKDARRRMRSGGNFLEIGTAHSTGMHPNQQFSCANLRHRHGFQTDVIHPA